MMERSTSAPARITSARCGSTPNASTIACLSITRIRSTSDSTAASVSGASLSPPSRVPAAMSRSAVIVPALPSTSTSASSSGRWSVRSKTSSIWLTASSTCSGAGGESVKNISRSRTAPSRRLCTLMMSGSRATISSVEPPPMSIMTQVRLSPWRTPSTPSAIIRASSASGSTSSRMSLSRSTSRTSVWRLLASRMALVATARSAWIWCVSWSSRIALNASTAPLIAAGFSMPSRKTPSPSRTGKRRSASCRTAPSSSISQTRYLIELLPQSTAMKR